MEMNQLLFVGRSVGPAWTLEPGDVAVVAGAPLVMQCAAAGHPAPALAWYRRIG